MLPLEGGWFGDSQGVGGKKVAQVSHGVERLEKY